MVKELEKEISKVRVRVSKYIEEPSSPRGMEWTINNIKETVEGNLKNIIRTTFISYIDALIHEIELATETGDRVV